MKTTMNAFSKDKKQKNEGNTVPNGKQRKDRQNFISTFGNWITEAVKGALQQNEGNRKPTYGRILQKARNACFSKRTLY